MTVMATAHRTASEAKPDVGLRCRITFRSGRKFAGELPPERHRTIQLELLHRHTEGLVELTPGTRDADGRLHVDRRSRPEHYLPGGASGKRAWLPKFLEHAERITAGEYARKAASEAPREEVFVGVAVRHEARGSKHAVSESRFLWVDIDRPDRLEVLWEFLAERPCHLLIESAGSGGVHAYWELDRPLPGRFADREPIEQANLRIIHALGEDVADPNCKERSRVLRVAGTINFKSGRYARIIEANLALAPYEPAKLVGDLTDPPNSTPVARRHDGGVDDDPYKRLPAATYFALIAGTQVPPRGGLVRCPAHEDEHPSCSVSATEPVWKCHACGAGGTIYDLASAVLGGPTGQELRGDAFKRARAFVVETLGEVKR
ncbi:hypothetical protein AYO39_00530 [Actinobacteria bacterium SCGC AG-212-D09]|nr:hypothetical protein AYO39_00530 [Actinobacteria bacterium SCGC AG-212-D09]